MLSTNHQLCCPSPYFLIHQLVSHHLVSSGSSIFMCGYGNPDACLQVLPNFLAIRPDVTSLSGDLLLPRASVTSKARLPGLLYLTNTLFISLPILRTFLLSSFISDRYSYGIFDVYSKGPGVPKQAAISSHQNIPSCAMNPTNTIPTKKRV